MLITPLMILPQNSAEAVDYANTDLPRLIDIKLTGDLLSSQKLKLTLEITIQTKVNPLKSFTTYLRGPKRDPLKPPCTSYSNPIGQTLSRESVGTKTYILERTIEHTSLELCTGDYTLGIDEYTVSFYFLDVADHELRINGSPIGRSEQYSNIWSSATGARPQCEQWIPEATSWGPYNPFKVCDLGFNLSDKLKSLPFVVTSEMLLKAKAKAEAEAKAKAEAEAKAKAEAASQVKAQEEDFVLVTAEYKSVLASLKKLVGKFPKEKSLVATLTKLSDLSIVKGADLSEIKIQIMDAKATSSFYEMVLSEVTKEKTTITCIKGKLTKKVTAVNPKCPKGYKKK